MITLLEECLEVLKDHNVLDDIDKKNIETKFYKLIKLTSWGRVDWSFVTNKISVKNISELRSICDEVNYYIIWTDVELPIIKCCFKKIIDNIDDVTAVSHDTWLLSEDGKTLVEFYHESEITVANFG